MHDLVTVEVSEAIATVTLNRPEAMNALSVALRNELSEIFVSINEDDAVRAVILTGAGERAFSAGVDLKELGASSGKASTLASNPCKEIEKCSKPVIGAINGVAVTGGFELALACDILIASDNARFADTHARVGLIPGWGLSQKLSRIIGISRAKELSFTGNFMDAQWALEWGLVNHILPQDELLPCARKMADEIAGVDPEFLASYKALIDDGYATQFGDALKMEAARSDAANSQVSAENVEARRAQVLERGRKQ